MKNLDPKTFADNLFGPDDERKAKCIHCGAVWYEIHYKDGVCHSCQQKKLPGESVLIRRAIWKSRASVLFLLIILFLAVMFLIKN